MAPQILRSIFRNACGDHLFSKALSHPVRMFELACYYHPHLVLYRKTFSLFQPIPAVVVVLPHVHLPCVQQSFLHVRLLESVVLVDRLGFERRYRRTVRIRTSSNTGSSQWKREASRCTQNRYGSPFYTNLHVSLASFVAN